jgi:hypothetical protein
MRRKEENSNKNVRKARLIILKKIEWCTREGQEERKKR